MAEDHARQQIITFKVDASLIEALEGVGNRSEFIRSAVEAALENTCPLCKGRGTLTPNQRSHWDAAAGHHRMKRCHDCNEFHMVCTESRTPRVHR